MKGRGTVLSLYNGSTWDVIASVYSISGGGRDREIATDDDLLDASAFRTSEAGAKFFEDITVEIQYDPADTGGANHALLRDEYDNDSEQFYKVKYTDAAGSGEIWHAVLKSLGNGEILPNNHVRRRVVITPTGKGYVAQENIDLASLPSI